MEELEPLEPLEELEPLEPLQPLEQIWTHLERTPRWTNCLARYRNQYKTTVLKMSQETSLMAGLEDDGLGSNLWILLSEAACLGHFAAQSCASKLKSSLVGVA